MKLKDGSEISILDGTELGVGTEVFIVDTDGNQRPIDDDSYVLDDGRTIVVKGKYRDWETPETSAQMESTEDEKDSEKDKEKMSDGEETTSVEERVDGLFFEYYRWFRACL